MRYLPCYLRNYTFESYVGKPGDNNFLAFKYTYEALQFIYVFAQHRGKIIFVGGRWKGINNYYDGWSTSIWPAVSSSIMLNWYEKFPLLDHKTTSRVVMSLHTPVKSDIFKVQVECRPVVRLLLDIHTSNVRRRVNQAGWSDNYCVFFMGILPTTLCSKSNRWCFQPRNTCRN